MEAPTFTLEDILTLFKQSKEQIEHTVDIYMYKINLKKYCKVVHVTAHVPSTMVVLIKQIVTSTKKNTTF